MKTVSVIGACGHVGFPFSVVVADAGHKVHGIDLNPLLCDRMNSGIMPYIEYGASEPFTRVLQNGNLSFTVDAAKIADSNVVAIMIGTPVDSEGNPRLDDILNFVEVELCEWMEKDTLVILRSTVSPGTTEIIRNLIEERTGLKEGKDFYLVFCPERVAQSYGIEESKKFPQLVGAFSEESYLKAKEFFTTFVNNECFWLWPREAEVGKLITNMYRYVSFALANEFWMIADKQGVDIHRVIDACNKDYGRMAVPKPGPNVGGPCLFKDGRFLLTDVPFADLINTSFIINEGMPDYIFNRMKQIKPGIKKVLMLGLTFKAECDDTRNSLSYKFKKVCKKNGVDVVSSDPFVYEDRPDVDPSTIDAIVLMTPHSQFKNFITENGNRFGSTTVIADVWKHFPESRLTTSGIYFLGNCCTLTKDSEAMYRTWGYL